jgi:hypothetical protein
MRKTVALLFVLASAGFGRAADADPRALVDQAIRAHGGNRLAKAQTAVRELKGSMMLGTGEVPFTAEMATQLPEKLRATFDVDAGGQKLQMILVVNGNRGWRSAGGAVADLTPLELAELREEAYISWVETLLPLRDTAFQLAALPEVKVDGKPALGVKVSRQGYVDLELYFDKDSHLLVKVARKTREAGRAVTKERVFAEPKAFDGLRLPSKVQDFTDGRKVAEATVTGYKFPSKVDDNQFAKP